MRAGRRVMCRATTLLGVAAVGACVVAPGSSAQPVEDAVTGTASLAGNAAVQFDAHSGPLGENPMGTLTTLLPGGPFSTQVTCLTVSGNRATVGFGFENRIGGLVFVEDNDGVGVDRFIGLGRVLEPPPAVCPAAPPPGLELLPIASGDLTVMDAQPLPTSRDDCKQGRWRSFGGAFRNQGQCVAAAERGPKPE